MFPTADRCPASAWGQTDIGMGAMSPKQKLKTSGIALDGMTGACERRTVLAVGKP